MSYQKVTDAMENNKVPKGDRESKRAKREVGCGMNNLHQGNKGRPHANGDV